MKQAKAEIKPSIRYSVSFKMSVVRELEEAGLTVLAIRRKYGIRDAGTAESWLGKYGNGTRGQRILVQKPEEINELKELKQRLRVLERTVGNLHVELALERAYANSACERAGIGDVAAF